MRTFGLLGISLAFLFAACGGGGGGGSPTNPPPPTTPPGTASFALAGAGYNNQGFGYSNSSGNLIFCRPNGALWWVRLAATMAGNGDAGPHIDIDLCNYNGSGVFAPMAPGAGCGAGRTWDIFWHDGPAAFVNQATSAPCQLALTLTGSTLEGVFSCRGLQEIGGNRNLDVVDGMFRCTV